MQSPLPIQIEGQSWVDWRLWGQTPFLHVTTIFCIIVSLSLFNGYHLILNKKEGMYFLLWIVTSLEMYLAFLIGPFRNVFIWRVLIECLSLGLAMKQCGLFKWKIIIIFSYNI